MKSRNRGIVAIDSEKAVLNAILQDNRLICKVLDILDPADFSHPAHQIILAAMIELAEENRPCNLESLERVLRENGTYQIAGGERYLKELLLVNSHPEQMERHCKTVRNAALARNLSRHCKRVEKDIQVGKKGIERLLDEAILGILAVCDSRVRPFFVQIGTLLEEYGKSVERIKSGDLSPELPTGNPRLDHLIGGLRGGELIMLAGYSGTGKTALALYIVLHVATRDGLATPVALFTPSLAKEVLAIRMLAQATGLDIDRLRHGTLSDSEAMRVKEGIHMLRQVAVFIDDAPQLSVSEIQAKVRMLRSEKSIGLVIVDSSVVGPKEFTHMAELTFSLKIMAKNLNVPVLFVVDAISSRTMEGFTRKDTILELKELLGWPYIEADIDVAIFALSCDRNRSFGKGEFFVARNRTGGLGSIVLGDELA